MNEFSRHISLKVKRGGPELECKDNYEKTQMLTCKCKVWFVKNSHNLKVHRIQHKQNILDYYVYHLKW